MKQPDERIHDLRRLFFRVVNKASHLARRPLDYGTGDILHPSQMHAIEMVGENPGISVTALAKRLGITKGAVSQMVKKLEELDMLSRYKQRGDAKAVLLKLGKKGKIAFATHKEWHDRYDTYFLRGLRQMSGQQYEHVHQFLRAVEDSMNRYLEDIPLGEAVNHKAVSEED
ncbi:MAG: MarR family transcriptional regulator [Deltaproteobacteria bacterium]|nr:MarR family transcriptional regulator [Deltaproteobacteria bacterium]